MTKFRKYRFADVGKSELGKKETCAKHKIDHSQNGRSNNVETEKCDNVSSHEQKRAQESQQRKRNQTFSKFTTNDTVSSKLSK